MKTQLHVIFILTVACLLIFGCELTDPDDESSLKKGSFSVQFRGYIDRLFQGEAVFNTLKSLAGEPYFFLMLQDIEEPGEKYRIVEFFHSHGRPDVGTYGLANMENPDEMDRDKFTGRYSDSDIYGSFKSTGGTLTIRSANNDVLRGTFGFPAYEWVHEGGGEYIKVEVIITGEFYAEKGDIGIILN